MGSKLLGIVARYISSGAGSGYASVVPGTFGSGAALIFWWLMFQIGVVSSLYTQVALIALTATVGTAAVGLSIQALSDKDPQWIVIDEWAGLFIALIGLQPTQWAWVATAFILFRIFDATKIGPIGWAEQLPREFGIMADDIVAGVCTAVVIYLLRQVALLM